MTQEVASMKLRLDAAMQVRREQEAATAASGAAAPLDGSVKAVNPLLEAGKTLNDIPALVCAACAGARGRLAVTQ